MARSSHSGQLNLLLPANLELTPCPLLSLVFDHGTGKPKGFGFCEYKDPETAASALRNLQGVEVGGRGLRLDFADTEDAPPSKRGPPGPGGLAGPGNIGRGGPGDVVPKPLPPGVNLPPGVSAVDSISQTLAAMPPGQLLDIMSQMKVRCGPSSCRGRGGERADSTRGTQALVTTSPYDARALLQSNPQLSYALFQAMLMMNIVDPAILNVRLPTPPPPSPFLPYPSPPTENAPPNRPSPTPRSLALRWPAILRWTSDCPLSLRRQRRRKPQSELLHRPPGSPLVPSPTTSATGPRVRELPGPAASCRPAAQARPGELRWTSATGRAARPAATGRSRASCRALSLPLVP